MSGRQEREVRRVVGGRHRPEDVVPSDADLSAAHEPWGSRSRGLRMGSVAIELQGLDRRLDELVGSEYDGFLEEPARAGARRVEVVRSPRARWLHLPRGEGRGEEARIDARATADGLELWSYCFASRFDRAGTSARLLLADGPDLDLSQALQNFLRFFVSAAALRSGGFLLHSSGVVRDGSAFLFFGPSGAGKSTAMANSPGTRRLGDDLVLVEPTGSAFRACGVPFRGSFVGAERNASGCAPVRVACRLFHAHGVRLEHVPRAVQAAELLGELPFLLDDGELRQRAAANVRAFVHAVPVRRLHLRPDPSFWSVLGDLD